MQDLAIVVPLKEFVLAKTRLREGGVDNVDTKIRDMASGVFSAARPRPLFVSCESDDVEEFALQCSATPLRSSSTSLNEAVTFAYHALSSDFRRIMIVHADLLYPEGLGDFDPFDGVTIVTDHHGRGTNVLVVPTGFDFTFRFGADSASSHQLEAQRTGVPHRLVRDSPWRYDVDEPGDLIV